MVYNEDDNYSTNNYLIVDTKAVLLEKSNFIEEWASYKDGMMVYTTDSGGELYTVDKNGNKTKIADDVTSFKTLANGEILFVSQGSSQRYDGNQIKLVANDVNEISFVKEKEYVDGY